MKRVFTFTEASSMRPYTQLIHSNGWFHVLGGFLSELKDAGIWLRMRARDEASGRLNTRIVSWNVELPNFWSSVFGFFFSFACFISVFPFALSSLLHNIPWISFHRLQRTVLQCWIACAESAHGPQYKRDTQFAMICVSRISKKEWNEYSKRGN